MSQNTSKFGLVTFLGLVLVLLSACASNQYPELSHDGLQLVSDTSVDAVYKKPEAQFSDYSRLALQECNVAFKKNWQRDQNRDRGLGGRVSNDDMAKIKATLSQSCHDTFLSELTKDGGYQVVEGSGDEVLAIRPSIVDLDIAAPDTMSAGRSRSYTTSAGSMRLYLEVYDSTSGEILGRVIDRRKAPDTGSIRWSNSVTNKAEADRMFRRWAVMLRKHLDSVRSK